jgi:Xaa-Pro dipeptidase
MKHRLPKIAMSMNRRTFFCGAAAVAGSAAINGGLLRELGAQSMDDASSDDLVPGSIRALKPMISGVAPITDEERRGRIEKAQRLMVENKIAAIFMEGGSSLFYYTGVEWGHSSERTFGAVIPAHGEIAWVCPKFEEERAREMIRGFGKDVRTWEEDENPYRLIAQIIRDCGAATGRVGFEERTRFFIFNGVRKEAPNCEYVIADPVTAGCRMFKSPAELALMQRAADIHIAAYKSGLATMKAGMSQDDLSRNLTTAINKVAPGGAGFAFALFGPSAAFPHGTRQPARLKEGDIVLIDGGCSVEGYWSDISRTTVFGKPTQRQRDVWNVQHRAQAAAYAAAQVGVPCEAVDAAQRKVLTDAGFGPGYKLPGDPARVGHGIGLDIHEWTYLVHGNKSLLQPGMCFSNEPHISIYGEFGVRVEDCIHITEKGARYFTTPSPSIEQPFA